MDKLNPEERQPKGLVIGGRGKVVTLLESQAELLRSEGLDPAWPGFEAPKHRKDSGAESKPEGGADD